MSLGERKFKIEIYSFVLITCRNRKGISLFQNFVIIITMQKIYKYAVKKENFVIM